MCTVCNTCNSCGQNLLANILSNLFPVNTCGCNGNNNGCGCNGNDPYYANQYALNAPSCPCGCGS